MAFFRNLPAPFFLLMLLAQVAGSQSFPARVYRWTLADSAAVPVSEGARLPAEMRESAEAYGVSHVLSARYEREGEEVSVRIMRAPDPLRAFGLFTVLCGAESYDGIIGDAFQERAGSVLVNYGPFCFDIAERPGRRTRRIDGSVVLAIKKMLYAMADCTYMDIPLPDEERVLGSERYLCGIFLTRQLRDHYPLAVLDAMNGSCVFTALYRKQRLRFERQLLLLPAPDTSARHALARTLHAAMRESTRALESCGIPVYHGRTAVYAIRESSAGIVVCRALPGDPGWCGWARDLGTGTPPPRSPAAPGRR